MGKLQCKKKVTEMPTVHIPASLRSCTDGQSTLEVNGATSHDLLAVVRRDHQQLAERILGAENNLLSHIQMFVNGKQVDASVSVAVDPASEILLVSPLAGG